MLILNPQATIDSFFHRLRRASQRALLLDYDGTLAPFALERDQAFPYPGIRKLLDRIMASDTTRLVIISGRRTGDLLPLLRLRRRPEIWASHGWERLFADGRYEIIEPDTRAMAGLVEADAWRARIARFGGRTEEKPASIALHWRGLEATAVAQIRALVDEPWARLAQETGLQVHPFDGGIELRAPGRHKGHAVETIHQELRDASPIAYLGDDLTDEDAFRSIKRRGLSVLVRPELRPTLADVWLRPPQELLMFLERWAETMGPHA
ncbi:MAG: trehalose-phosphatase [Gammaproteobacteria bacterium]